MVFLLAFSLGIFSAFQLSVLPDANVFWLLPLLVLACLVRQRIVATIFIFCFAFLYTLFYAWLVAPNKLDTRWQGKDIEVVGQVSGLPENHDGYGRFEFDVESMTYRGTAIEGPQRIRLSWYHWQQPVKAGERWFLTVRLKHPHSYSNPGGFDFERWLFEHRIGATGYVKLKRKHQRLQVAGIGLHPLREALQIRIRSLLQDDPMSGFIQALVMGSRGDLDQHHWQILNATGTNHLMAISGLHIGLLAGFTFWLLRLVWRNSARLCLLMAAPRAAAIAAGSAAVIYATLAGFAVPTQRALIMFSVVMLMYFSGRYRRPSQILGIAFVVVLLVDPFAFLSAGFWLSFIAVAAIFYAMQNRYQVSGWWWRWGRLQWIVTLLMVPALLLFFQRVSLVSPLANLLVVPWMSFIVVPLSLLGGLLSFIPWLAEPVLWLASSAMQLAWSILSVFADVPFASLQTAAPTVWTLVLALAGFCWFLLPRGIPFRFVGLLWILPAFLISQNGPKVGEARLNVLDVGQGTAVVVETANHALLYDTGPRFSDSFNAAQAVIIPFLRQRGIYKLDTLVLSHGDRDHAGGIDEILSGMEIGRFLNGAPQRVKNRGESCVSGTKWRLDGVDFEIIYPAAELLPLTDNNGSCVLKISAMGQILLLTGDIEQKAERFLLESHGLDLDADVLLIPHHGSKTSSTEAFIAAISPQIAINSVGFANRYHLPNRQVIERYKRRDIALWDTATQGAITLTLSTSGIQGPISHRQEAKRFWHD